MRYLRICTETELAYIHDKPSGLAQFGVEHELWRDYLVSDEGLVTLYVKPKPKNGWIKEGLEHCFYRDDVKLARFALNGDGYFECIVRGFDTFFLDLTIERAMQFIERIIDVD